ncbi:MAG: hypothetical protein ACRD6W_09525, partial [Nitrososphaerales archaeon]
MIVQSIALGASAITAWVDPNGSTIVPSYYDSHGNLILGYNATSNSMIFSSQAGILMATNDGFAAFVFQGNNFTVQMNAVGSPGVDVPYEMQLYDMSANSEQSGYAGSVPVGSSLSVPVDIAANGTISPQPAVLPDITLTGSLLTVIPTLSGGGTIAASSAFISVGGNIFQMTEVSPTLFELNLTPALEGQVADVYVIAPSVAGGYLPFALPPALTGVVVSPSPSTVDNGQSSSVTVSWTGGIASYTVTLYSGSSPTDCSLDATEVQQVGGVSTTSAAFEASPSSTSYYCATVQDSVSASASSSAPAGVTVDADPTVNVTPAGPLSFDAGQPSTGLTATVAYSGANAASVEWYGSPTLSCNS